MSTEDASLRQDLIENAVQHEVVPIEETVPTEQPLDASFAAELEHDLTIWPREYLETYLDSDDQGRIPLNEARLQDLLEDAFDRDEQLVRSFRQSRNELNPDVKRKDRGDPVSSQNGVLEHSESFEAAQAQVNSLLGHSAETRFPLAENSVYVGSIISETAEYLIQKISGTTAIAHPKSLFSDLPHIGQVVRIAYEHQKAAVREIAARQISRGLER